MKNNKEDDILNQDDLLSDDEILELTKLIEDTDEDSDEIINLTDEVELKPSDQE